MFHNRTNTQKTYVLIPCHSNQEFWKLQNIREEENLRRLRLKKGKTQEELAEDAGISQVQVARIEGGKINTTIFTVQRQITALNINASELF